ncbi:hypothetical protein GCM10009560_09110 [Nonomuraea longicatena]|uniref:Uncharacterized protein n=1 Tax=Nonomuraea longicatena TaxID=83682 RepID=A0ABP3Z724_9ACTN
MEYCLSCKLSLAVTEVITPHSTTIEKSGTSNKPTIFVLIVLLLRAMAPHSGWSPAGNPGRDKP